MLNQSLHHRHILVTGATGALGSALCLALAERGATLILLARQIPKLEALYDQIEALGAPQPAIYPLDLAGANPQDFAELADNIDKELGALHALIHCAGEVAQSAPLELQSSGSLAKDMASNFQGPMLLTQACLGLLKQQPTAHLGFTLNDRALTYFGGYAMANGAMDALFRLCQAELSGSGVNSFAIQPPPMRSVLRRQAFPAENIDCLTLPSDCIAPYLLALGVE